MLPPEIKIAIRNRRAVVVSNTSIYITILSTHWILIILEKNIEINGSINFKDWAAGIISRGEVAGALDLIQYIIKRGKYILITVKL